MSETNPSLKRPTFETHAQPAMTKFITSLTNDMAGTPEPAAEPAPESGKDIPPVPEPKPADKTAPKEERTWPRNAKDWEAYKKADKERLDKLGTELTEWKVKYEKAENDWKAKPAAPPDYEVIKKERDSLKTERDEFDQRLRTVAVENHPKFKAYFDGRVSEQLQMAEQIAGDKGKEIVELLKAPESTWRDQRLSDLLTTLNALQSTRIGGIMNNLSSIESERKAEIAKAKSSHDQLLVQEQAKAKERLDGANKMFGDIVGSLQDPKSGIVPFQIRDGDQKWNDSVKARIESAQNLLFGKQDDKTMIRAALDAVSLPAVLEHSKALLEENAQLKTQIKELQSSQPTLEAGRTNGGTTASPVPVRLGNLAHRTPQDAVKGFVDGIRTAMDESE